MSSLKGPIRRALHLRRVHGGVQPVFRRQFHASKQQFIVKPFLLADIGEGITECQLIQWFVQPGARVEQFDKICEVQSDKASVEITSPFDGVIKKLYYEPDDMAKTGKPLIDIDIQGELSDADKAKLGDGGHEEPAAGTQSRREAESRDEDTQELRDVVEDEGVGAQHTPRAEDTAGARQTEQNSHPRPSSKGGVGTLATPAVRRLVKEHSVNIADVQGTGKGGRVLKEDVHKHVSRSDAGTSQAERPTMPSTAPKADRKVPLSNVQNQMFKMMTRSLNIPHFLYSSTADMTAVSTLRKKLNTNAAPEDKLTHLAFIMKAISIALWRHPLLNASLHTSDSTKPELTYKGSHNFGIAIDAPAGLLVPVVKNVQEMSIGEIAAKMRGLSAAARENKLAPADFKDATFTVSNIGSVGGGVVAPVISEPQVAIVGVGRSRMVPAFDENEVLVRREELVLSWSADHRVVDGAECARCAERVRMLLEDPASMLVEMR